MYNMNPFNAMGNNPISFKVPDGDLIFSDMGYNIQKYFSPIAFKVNAGFGSEGYHFGIEASFGIPKLIPLSYRFHFGSTYYSGAYDNGVSGHQSMNGKEITYFGVFSLASTQYHSQSSDGTNTSQTTGVATIGGMFVNVKYQNDWWPGFVNKMAIGMKFGDKGDRYRSAALQYNVFSIKIGFNLFTGDPGFSNLDRPTEPGINIHENRDVYNGGNADKYRSGILYLGFGKYRLGANTEGIRHAIQNQFAHDFLQGEFDFSTGGDAKHFRFLAGRSKFHWYVGSGYGTGLW